MIVFNQANNNISINYANNITFSNALTKYTKEVATGTSTTVSFQFTFTGRDFVLLNTNATSGTIDNTYPSSNTNTISSPTTISTDTLYEGKLTINSGATTTITSDTNVRIHGTFGRNHEAIDFSAENLTKKDLYFDMGSVKTWTVSLTLNSSSNVEIGSLITGNFIEYGFTTDLTNGEADYQGKLNGMATAGNFKALRDYANSRDDYYVCIANRSINDASLFALYGKIQVKEQTMRGNSMMNSSGVQIDTLSIEVS